MILYLCGAQINQMLDDYYLALSALVLKLNRGSNALYTEHGHQDSRDAQRTNKNDSCCFHYR